MSTYTVKIAPAAEKALRRIDNPARRRLSNAIDALAQTPRPAGAKALQAQRGRLRIRVGDYRIVYEVNDGELLVLVVTVGHRREVYDRL